VPIASTNAEVILGLSSPGMLMTDGCHGATGTHTVIIDSQLMLIRPPVAVLAH